MNQYKPSLSLFENPDRLRSVLIGLRSLIVARTINTVYLEVFVPTNVTGYLEGKVEVFSSIVRQAGSLLYGIHFLYTYIHN